MKIAEKEGNEGYLDYANGCFLKPQWAYHGPGDFEGGGQPVMSEGGGGNKRKPGSQEKGKRSRERATRRALGENHGRKGSKRTGNPLARKKKIGGSNLY